jgi:hypothetical protein
VCINHPYWFCWELNYEGCSSTYWILLILLRAPLAVTIWPMSDHGAQLWWRVNSLKFIPTYPDGIPCGRKLIRNTQRLKPTTFGRALTDSFHVSHENRTHNLRGGACSGDSRPTAKSPIDCANVKQDLRYLPVILVYCLPVLGLLQDIEPD